MQTILCSSNATRQLDALPGHIPLLPFQFKKRTRTAQLKFVPQTELKLAIGSVCGSLARHLSERTICGTNIRIIPVGMVQVVESLSLEDNHVIFMARDDLEPFLHRSIKALKTGSINCVARFARCKR